MWYLPFIQRCAVDEAILQHPLVGIQLVALPLDPELRPDTQKLRLLILAAVSVAMTKLLSWRWGN